MYVPPGFLCYLSSYSSQGALKGKDDLVRTTKGDWSYDFSNRR